MFLIEEKSKNKLLVKGTQISITESLADYSAVDYTLQYIFKKGTETADTFDCIPDGTDHLLEITPVQSTLLQTGYNICAMQVVNNSDPTEIIPIASLVIEFQPDPNTDNDARGFYLKVVEKLETAILALADKTMSSISIDGRSYTYKDLAELERSRVYYSEKAGVPSETQGRKRILVQFTNE